MKDTKLDIDHSQMPFAEALERYKKEGFIPFHTPGHKIGVGAPARLHRWMGESLAFDLGLMYALDDYHEPEGDYKKALELAATLYGVDRTWFSVNGTTGAIHMMMLATLNEGDTVILPREAHGSVRNGLILTGAKPVYLEGRFNERWGIPIGPTFEEVKATLDLHRDAKVLFLINPNYYGVAVELKKIIEYAHEHNVLVLVDEAHGPHLKFHEDLPVSAVDCGADLVSQSTHKIVGALTQTSMLHGQGPRIDYQRLDRVHQLLMSTSPNYLFLASLDMARSQLGTEGSTLLHRTIALSDSLRNKLNTIDGVYSPCLTDIDGAYALDRTKVIIDFSELGLTGKEAEQLLRSHKIEVELMKANHVLLLITLGDTLESIEAVVQAVQSIADRVIKRERNLKANQLHQDRSILLEKLPTPLVSMTPREAFYSLTEVVPIGEALGRISGETISYYPPGIPCIGMGEKITEEVLAYMETHQKAGYEPNGASDRSLKTMTVLCQ